MCNYVVNTYIIYYTNKILGMYRFLKPIYKNIIAVDNDINIRYFVCSNYFCPICEILSESIILIIFVLVDF